MTGRAEPDPAYNHFPGPIFACHSCAERQPCGRRLEKRQVAKTAFGPTRTTVVASQQKVCYSLGKDTPGGALASTQPAGVVVENAVENRIAGLPICL